MKHNHPIDESRPLGLCFRVFLWLAAAFGIFAGAAVLNGCASKPKPTVRLVAPMIKTANDHAAETASRVITAQKKNIATREAIAKSATTAAAVFQIAAPDLRPLVDQLRNEIAASDAAAAATARELADARTTANAASEAVQAALDEARKADAARIDAEHRAAIAGAERAVAVAQAKDRLMKLIWWRTAATVVAIVGALLIFRRPLGAMVGIPIP